MSLVQNVPFFSIMISMFSGIVSSILPEKWAKRLNAAMICLVGAMSVWLLQFLITSRIGSYTYMMGHFPAPWGNELRVGPLECTLALTFTVVMLLCVLGGCWLCIGIYVIVQKIKEKKTEKLRSND